MKCNKCNHTLPDDSVFCQYCGSRRSLFEREETPHTPSAAPRHYKLAPITDPTPREMLNNISIETITDEDERQNLEQYKKASEARDALNAELEEKSKQLHRFPLTREEAAAQSKLPKEIEELRDQIENWDAELLKMEATEPIQKLLARERKVAQEKKDAELMEIKQQLRRDLRTYEAEYDEQEKKLVKANKTPKKVKVHTVRKPSEVTQRPAIAPTSDFGLVPEKPIYTLAKKGMTGELEYLSSLRTPSGEKVRWCRCGSVNAKDIIGGIDVYDIYLMSGEKYTTLYINMYGAKASTKVPDGFYAPQQQPSTQVAISKATNAKPSKFEIINAFVLLFPIVANLIGLDWFHFQLENLLITSLCFTTVVAILKILNLTKFRNNFIFSMIIVCTLPCTLLPCFSSYSWDYDIWLTLILLIPTMYLWVCEFLALMKTYRTSQSYKLRCYKKIDRAHDYMEKGIISEAEYESLKGQILKKLE